MNNQNRQEAYYQTNLENGLLQLKFPLPITEDDAEDIHYLFTLILKQVDRWKMPKTPGEQPTAPSEKATEGQAESGGG